MVSNTSAVGAGILIGRRQRHPAGPTENMAVALVWSFSILMFVFQVCIGFVGGREMECQPHAHAPSLPIATSGR